MWNLWRVQPLSCVHASQFPTDSTARPSSPGSEHIEAQLIRRACEGDGQAVRALYDRYSPRVYAVVRRIAGDDDLAHDYAQETWIRALRALPSFRGDARFSTWLHRIAVNTALQAVRKAKTRRMREMPLPEVVAVAPQVGDVLLERKLEQALDKLPEGMRKVLILHDVEGYTHEEIGTALGVTSGTSKSQLFKARAKMRRMLRGFEPQPKEVEAWSV
ncbi:MAG: RNA polymerase sigma factor [Gemmatimonadetes bacterium]|nr:RNA polymerase sigma factor [Gemmatimonadota bacterium]MCY3610794.1 RNA polymerase sigma factor [Gemmatimonadota bacterium]MCY3679208.1 RNA polymerase sigma factor [Gemmatimonadota bacterium]MYA44314.1 RNA polymerase sigma factor [Gemmatimonadota bacterium]